MSSEKKGDQPPPYNAGQTQVHGPQTFNKGARDPTTVPPPPPGYAPNTAQQDPPVAQGTFDQGARFDPNKPVTVPPPPPGVAPTQAQVAASQGQTVVMSQQKRDNWGGGSDGGATMF